MNRRICAAVLAAALAACGSDDNDDDGNGGGTTAVTVTGTNATSANHSTSIVGQTTCDTELGALSTRYLLVGASSEPALCELAQTGDEKANATFVTLGLVRVSTDDDAPAAFATGNYAVQSSSTIPTIDTNGDVTFAFVSVMKNDAACADVEVESQSGSVTIGSISPSGAVSGSFDVTLDDGGRVTGSFSAAACSVTANADICSGSPIPDSGTCRP